MAVKLSPEQVRLIAVYWEKWQDVTLLTQPLDQQKAAEAITALYQLAGVDKPEIIFVTHPLKYYAQTFLRSEIPSIQQDGSLEQYLKSNPKNIFIRDPQQNIAKKLSLQLKLPIEKLFIKRIKTASKKIKQGKSRSQALLEAEAEVFTAEDRRQSKLLHRLIDQQFNQNYGTQAGKLFVPLKSSWIGDIYGLLNKHINLTQELKFMISDYGSGKNYNGIDVGCIDSSLLAFACARFDYCISVMDFPVVDTRWQVLQSLITECGSMLFPYEDFCIVCPRLFSI
ncbi:hypothetical protein [Crocosphaera sp. Alani8]|uniref:hypothetical protein n=1 Tax=Crocosphaera sp. Alani8 TaxID=3038952 RepID=UPI00313AC7CE